MPSASDILLQGATNRPEDDTSSAAGARDATARPLDQQMTATETLELVSDNAADTMNATIRRRLPSGVIQQEVVAVNGTTPVTIPNGDAKRIVEYFLASAPTGSVSLRTQGGAGTTYHTINPGEVRGFELFPNAQADVSGGSPRIFYAAVYDYNGHATEALLAAVTRSVADPDARFRFGNAPAQGDVAALANRRTAPAGVTFVEESNDQAIPGTDLGGTAAICRYLEMTLAAGDTAGISTFDLEIEGGSA